MSGPQIIDCEQGTPEWHSARAGIPTSSKFATVMAKGEGKIRRKYMLTLAGEILTGEVQETYSNAHMERGKEHEAGARSYYAFLHDVEIVQVGFIRNGDKGCSPDGLIGANGMYEGKSRQPDLQIDLLLADRVPPEHTAQLQGNLWVAEREWIDFNSRWPGLPPFTKRVYRDEAYISKIASEVARFNDELSALVEKIRGMDRPAEAA